MTFPELTSEVIAELVGSGGEFWWLRDGEYVANSCAWDAPETVGDLYMLAASPAWLSQFEGDWQACADQLNPLLARHSEQGV